MLMGIYLKSFIMAKKRVNVFFNSIKIDQIRTENIVLIKNKPSTTVKLDICKFNQYRLASRCSLVIAW